MIVSILQAARVVVRDAPGGWGARAWYVPRAGKSRPEEGVLAPEPDFTGLPRWRRVVGCVGSGQDSGCHSVTPVSPTPLINNGNVRRRSLKEKNGAEYIPLNSLIGNVGCGKKSPQQCGEVEDWLIVMDSVTCWDDIRNYLIETGYMPHG